MSVYTLHVCSVCMSMYVCDYVYIWISYLHLEYVTPPLLKCCHGDHLSPEVFTIVIMQDRN